MVGQGKNAGNVGHEEAEVLGIAAWVPNLGKICLQCKQDTGHTQNTPPHWSLGTF